LLLIKLTRNPYIDIGHFWSPFYISII
jgi:hypothetical protein